MTSRRVSGDGSGVDVKERAERMSGNNHEKLKRKSICRVSQCSIAATAGTPRDPACDYTDRRLSQPSQASCIAVCSYPLVFSASFTSTSPICFLLVPKSTIIPEPNIKLSLCISPSHDHELTETTAYAEYSIHRVGYIPSTA
jgi:hypothetical protein